MPKCRFEGINSPFVAPPLPANPPTPITQSSPLLDLPFQICEQIVEEASEQLNIHGEFYRDLTTLKSLTLVCRGLQSLAQPIVLSSITISTNKGLETIIRWVDRFDHPEQNPIRAIRFNKIGKTPNFVSQKRIAIFLAVIPKLRTLYFCEFVSTKIVPALAAVLSSLSSLETIQFFMPGSDINFGPAGDLLDCVRFLPKLCKVWFVGHAFLYGEEMGPLGPFNLWSTLSLQTLDGPPLRELHIQSKLWGSPEEFSDLFWPVSTIRCLQIHLNEETSNIGPFLPPSIVALSLLSVETVTSEITSSAITTLSLPLDLISGAGVCFRLLSRAPVARQVKNLVVLFVAGKYRHGPTDNDPNFGGRLSMMIHDICTLPSLEHLVINVRGEYAAPLLVEKVKKAVKEEAPSFRVSWSAFAAVDLLALEDRGVVIRGLNGYDSGCC